MTSLKNLHQTRGITPKRVTSGRIHLRGLAPLQHSSEKTPQWWLVVSSAASNLTRLRMEQQIFLTANHVFSNEANPCLTTTKFTKLGNSLPLRA